MHPLYTKLRPYLYITLIVLGSTLLLWLPFLLRASRWITIPIEDSNFRYIFRHYDGLLYLIAAKTFYSAHALGKIVLDTPISVQYYAAHLPLYPITLILLAPFVGFLKALVVSTVGFTLFLGYLFYYGITQFRLTKHPLILTTILMFLPRFAVVRSIGAPESMFLFFILLCLFSFEKKHYAIAGIAGALATMTKSPGLLLFPALVLVLIERYIKTRKIDYSSFWILLVPCGFLAVCIIYAVQYGDFFAYFHSGDNIHLAFPYSAFNYSKQWVGTAWLEEIVFYFVLYAIAIVTLARTHLWSFFYFGVVFFSALIFVEHRDIARYGLPLWPLACIAFEKEFTSRRCVIGMIIALPAIYMYAWNFMAQNVMPVSNWIPYT